MIFLDMYRQMEFLMFEVWKNLVSLTYIVSYNLVPEDLRKYVCMYEFLLYSKAS